MKSKIATNDSKRGYHLRFSNGQEWVLEAQGNKVELWLEEFARIIRLTNGHANSCPRLIFYQRRTPKRHLSKSKWQLHDLGILRYWLHTKRPDIICELSALGESNTIDYILMSSAMNVICHRVIEKGGLSVHGGLLAKGGKCVLLIAPSGMGKSTCCNRVPHPWNALCDDGSLIAYDGKGKCLAHPLPTWSNYFLQRDRLIWDIQKSYPVSAIFFLQKSQIDEITPLNRAMALACVHQSNLEASSRVTMRLDPLKIRVFKNKTFDNCCKLIKSVPSYILRFSRTGRFWELMDEVIS